MRVVGLHKKVLKIVEAEVAPAISEIWRGTQGEHELKVFVVLIVGFVGLSQEAEPNPPLVEKQLFLKHVL